MPGFRFAQFCFYSVSGDIYSPTAQSSCPLSNAAAAYVFNATVVPIQGALNVLVLWTTGESEPLVSTLNAFDGAETSNMAIVPTNNNDIDVDAESQQPS